MEFHLNLCRADDLALYAPRNTGFYVSLKHDDATRFIGVNAANEYGTVRCHISLLPKILLSVRQNLCFLFE